MTVSVYRFQSVSAGGVSKSTESGLVLATDHSIFQALHYFGFSLDIFLVAESAKPTISFQSFRSTLI